MTLTIVTATTNLERAADCLNSWLKGARTEPRLVIEANGTDHVPAILSVKTTVPERVRLFMSDDYLGTVPAFNEGVSRALEEDADIIACFHDDLEIHEDGWDDKVLEHFRRHPACGLAGFGGAIGLGDERMYQQPYDPMSLARKGFRSNLVDAEVHGIRSTLAERVACLDGFSQIGRREFWSGDSYVIPRVDHDVRPVLEQIEDHGVIHHFYDGALGALAARLGWEAWYLPIACKHYGGRTAVGDPGYQAWAKEQIPGGDQGYWLQSHKNAYDWLTDVLPLRV